MKLEFHNIAKISSASIDMNGLTVIAGDNGTGKSTVGKLLFMIVKVLKATRFDAYKVKRETLEKKIHTMCLRLRNLHEYSNPGISTFRPSELSYKLLAGTLTIDELRGYIDGIVSSKQVSPRTAANLINDLDAIESCLSINNRVNAQIASIQSMVESEFFNSICSVGTSSSKVSFVDDSVEDSFLNILFENDKVVEVTGGGSESVEDVSYVESPLYLHILESLRLSIQYVETDRKPLFRGMVPAHIKDFVDKMYDARTPIGDLYGAKFLAQIESLVEGSFRFEKNSSRLQFYDRSGNSYLPINVASGIKSFGVLQLLLNGNNIDPNRILIWDEPENHLHPSWQIEFADTLVSLASSGIPIVVSTHSPYFLQAIRFCAAKYNVENSVNYYFAEESGNGLSTLSDVTHDLNRVFTKLARPLNDIINVDRERGKR